jgi:RNA polymerase sigma-32 factor
MTSHIATLATLPALDGESGLSAYLQQVRRFPMLQAEEEYMLARRWQQHGDVAAAHRLVTSHLRLVVRIAMGYRGYGLPMAELISEGNIGLMQGVKKFDPERGFRLSTYAMWWIKAAIQEFVLGSWSMVTIGTAVARKKLLFSLNSVKRKLGIDSDTRLTQADVTKIANATHLGEKDVIEIEVAARGAIVPLDAPVRTGNGETLPSEIADPNVDVEGQMVADDERRWQRKLVERALLTLDEREREIVRARNLCDEPETLEDLSKRFGVSRERVRQLEERALAKLQARTRELARETASANA